MNDGQCRLISNIIEMMNKRVNWKHSWFYAWHSTKIFRHLIAYQNFARSRSSHVSLPHLCRALFVWQQRQWLKGFAEKKMKSLFPYVSFCFVGWKWKHENVSRGKKNMGEIFAKRIFPIRCRTQPPIASDAKLKFSRHSDANRNKIKIHTVKMKWKGISLNWILNFICSCRSCFTRWMR